MKTFNQDGFCFDCPAFFSVGYGARYQAAFDKAFAVGKATPGYEAVRYAVK